MNPTLFGETTLLDALGVVYACAMGLWAAWYVGWSK